MFKWQSRNVNIYARDLRLSHTISKSKRHTEESKLCNVILSAMELKLLVIEQEMAA